MKITVELATLVEKEIIQNMARFYVYDMSRFCGRFESAFDWAFPENGLYAAEDYSRYWDEPDRYPFIIKIDNELGGFALVSKHGSNSNFYWNMGEFFIVAKFQGLGIGRQAAVQIFEKFKGQWEVKQLLSNKPAIAFWKKVINDYTKGNYLESKKQVTEPEIHDMITLEFMG